MSRLTPVFLQKSFPFFSLLALVFLSLPLITSGQTYTTTGNSHDWKDPAAWNCVGGGCGSIPPNPVDGEVQVNILDSIFYEAETFRILTGGVYIGEGGKLEIVYGVEAQVDFLIDNYGYLGIENGSLVFRPVYSEGDQISEPDNTIRFLNHGYIELTKAYLHFSKKFSNEGTILFDEACLTVSEGDFENSGQVEGIANEELETEGMGNIKVANGNLINTGYWSPNVAYCASEILSENLPGSPNCEMVTEACDCLREPCVIQNPDILPGYDPTARNEDIIGSALTALNQNPGNNGNQDIFVFDGAQNVLVDIIYFEGQFDNVANILNTNFGISQASFINNGPGSQVITVFFPISDLRALNTFPDAINFVRPTPPATAGSNSSLQNQGDLAQESFLTRAGFALSGEGVKIGVLSDSYNQNGDQGAVQDISSGVLPGPANPNGFAQEVEVLADYPFGAASDEGRAMLQIVHSVAPGAELAFHTGFVSPGNFAEGIRALANAGCDVIVDDITYITEPFFTDSNQGVVAQAVAEVTAGGVEYFTSAGNFASRAYESIFNPGPAGVNQNNHDFGGGDFLQALTLGTGDFLIVLQWVDDFYSIDGGLGAQNDLDFYLADENGNLIYGFNRNNLGEDPIEIMPFRVINPTTTNLLIKRVSGTDNMPFRYIVFKAGEGNNGFSAEYFNNASTIVGHANSPAAITVGAVRYEDTPNFGGVLETERFSSTGDPAAPVKPDFTAPNGGNVTVDLGGGDYSGDADNLPNFFGTSAAAPHAAGVAALLLEAQAKFDVSFDIRTKLKNTAISYGEPAYRSGAGFINAFAAASSFANPSPVLARLNTDDLSGGQNPGEVEFTLVAEGSFFTDETLLYFRGEVLTPISRTETSITVSIPPFVGNPVIWVQTPPLTNSGKDGGADSLYFFDPVRTPVAIKVEESTKKYGEALPAFTFTTDPVLAPELMALLPAMVYTTQANDLSDVGIYGVAAAFDLAEGEELAPALRELFEFSFESNFLTVEKTDLLITPNPLTVFYGEQIRASDITFTYEFGDGLNIPNKSFIQGQLAQDHRSSIADDIAVLRNISLANISLANISLANKAFIASYNSLQNISLANISLANGMDIIEVDARLLEPTQNLQQGTDFIGNISLANFISLANTRANSLGGTARADYLLTNISLANISLANISLANISLANFISLANISLANISLANISLANGETLLDFQLPLRNFISLANNHNTDIISIIAEEDIGEQDIPLIPVNLITGLQVGEQLIVPAAFLSNIYSKNFNVSYAPGVLNIENRAASTILWPPDYTYQTFTAEQLTASGSGDCDGLSGIWIERVSSDEPEDDPGIYDGSTQQDIVISADCRSVQLRRERMSNKNGRVYTITVAYQDADGNICYTDYLISAPRWPWGWYSTAVDDGPTYIENCDRTSGQP